MAITPTTERKLAGLLNDAVAPREIDLWLAEATEDETLPESEKASLWGLRGVIIDVAEGEAPFDEIKACAAEILANAGELSVPGTTPPSVNLRFTFNVATGLVPVAS